jgi:hypothetical protein
METTEAKTFHGPVDPVDFSRALVAEFDQGNYRAKEIGRGDHRVVQITSRENPTSGGATALTIHISKVEDGVYIQVGQQQWLGVAASLGFTALSFIARPVSILHRLDDIAQDITSLQLTTMIWQTIARTAENLGLTHDLSEKLRRLTCSYCLTANPVGEPNCVSCGAPMGPDQPIGCPMCGYIVYPHEGTCAQCGAEIPR